jgi:hypothetical protein
VHEDVGAAGVRCNKAKALLSVEPFYRTRWHVQSPLAEQTRFQILWKSCRTRPVSVTTGRYFGELLILVRGAAPAAQIAPGRAVKVAKRAANYMGADALRAVGLASPSGRSSLSRFTATSWASRLAVQSERCSHRRGDH